MIGCRESNGQRVIAATRHAGKHVGAGFGQTHPAHGPALRNGPAKESDIDHARERLRTSDPSVKTPAQRKVAQHKVLWVEGIEGGHHKTFDLLAQTAHSPASYSLP